MDWDRMKSAELGQFLTVSDLPFYAFDQLFLRSKRLPLLNCDKFGVVQAANVKANIWLNAAAVIGRWQVRTPRSRPRPGQNEEVLV
jgi:hypothetical protein